ncbi:VOC family protein, partial [Kouleothrix sp.]
MFTTVDHIGFAVRDIEDAIGFYSQAFGVSEWERIAMPERYMVVAATR